MKLLATDRRPGISLLEVLTAIFIMGIGMLALLTLFPVGALSMARAVRDDRAATIAANAAGVAAAFDLRHDPSVVAALNASGPAAGFESGPGSPVYIDPQYAALSAGNLGDTTVAPYSIAPPDLRSTPGLRRSPVSAFNTLPLVSRYFTFQEEIDFETTGIAKGAPAVVRRPGTYTVAYCVRRPRHQAAELIDLTVVVYSLRPLDTPSGETVYSNATATAMNTGASQLRVPYTGPDKPNFARNPWLVDTTAKAGAGYIQGHFYKVENVTEEGPGSLLLDLDRPLKDTVFTLVHLEKVIAVVERGTSWKP